MVRILSNYAADLPPTVIHCFTGTADEAKKYIDMGLYIGLTGFLWKDRSDDGVKFGLKQGHIPLNRLVLETDAPFMYPKVNDKKIPAEIREKFSQEALTLHKFASFNRNEPCSLPAICELIAAYMGETPENVAKATTENAKRIYGLK
ncbi:CBN-CRN-2 protein [Aphelenchoides avenae]|nr:CBN-CRN-2 protein [Aphelenchus avenae]